MIQSISIKKIKGIEDKEFKLKLHPNKPSILVAPNGFGKSSFSTAFDSMNLERINLDEKDFYNGEENNDVEIKITIDNNIYTATNESNDILKEVDVFVIKNPIYAKSTSKNMGRFTSSKASLEISPVVLIDTIPKKVDFEYSITDFKSSFGENRKILPNIKILGLLDDLDFLHNFDKVVDYSKFSRKRDFLRPLNNLKNQINQQIGTAEEIKSWMSENLIEDLKSIDPLKVLVELIISKDVNDVDAYLIAIQLAELSQTSNFKDALKYKIYLKEKDFFDDLLSSFNTASRYCIKSKEENKSNKKRLIVTFPRADDISNGQRDILSFIAQIQRAKRKLRKENCILIVDEIFDYLDDANLVAFQFYITSIIEEFKEQGRKLYPLLLTHLDPYYFKAYCFDKHKMQIRFINKGFNKNKKSDFLNLVKNRNSFPMKSYIDMHWFHYHPESKDIKETFKEKGLNENWGNSHEFYGLAYSEVTRYFDGRKYDPIAVLLGTRIKIEEKVYNRLSNSQEKSEFLNTSKTVKKLDYCVTKGVEIPEIYYLLGLIHNENLHWKENRDYETPISSKLDNFVIKKLIKEVFKK